jgi:Glycosyltransferase family 87
VASFVVAAILSARALVRRGLDRRSAALFVGVTLISSYPFMFLLQRANMEVVNWIFVSLAIAAFWCQRWKLAGALLGVAISLKLFPFVLLGLFLRQRKFAAILIAIATAAVLDITALALLGPTIKIANHNLAAAMQGFGNGYVFGYHYWEIPFDHSLLAVFKHLAQHTYTNDAARFTRFAHGYMLTAAVGGLLLYFARIIRLPRVNQIVILLALSVLLPPVSGDYTLVHLYAGWMVLALFALQAEPGVLRSRVLPACFLLLAIVFCPETYMFIGQAHIAGSFKALALSVLVVMLLVFPLEENRPQPAEASALNEYTDKQAGSFRRTPAIPELP